MGVCRSEPPYDLLVLREATEAVQEVGGEGKEPERAQHLHVGRVGHVIELQIDHIT